MSKRVEIDEAIRAPLTAADVSDFIQALGTVADDDIAWSEGIEPPASPEDFALEAIYVICNSGMKNTVARRIFEKCRDALLLGLSASTAFGHTGKSRAMDTIWGERDRLFLEFNAASDKVAYCETLPWIGGITKFHLAKNFGVDCAKPDVHLQRLADREGCTAQALCERLAAETGYRVATVDLILWRACANGILNSRTGLRAAKARGETHVDEE